MAFLLIMSTSAFAQKKYDEGATDTSIKIGQTAPLSGPLSAYAIEPQTEAAYIKKVNDEGGVNGRKIEYLLYDDAGSPAKTVEQIRKLVEGDGVFLVFRPIGTTANNSIRKYMNDKKVPQLFVGSGVYKFGDPANFPWTMGWTPPYLIEGNIYGAYLLKNKPSAKIGVLYENDDYGKELLQGLEQGLGEKAAEMIVAREGYDLAEPVVDSRIVKLKDSGADTIVNLSTPKFAVQSIKKMAELGWKPLHILAQGANSVGTVLRVAGLENSVGIVSSGYYKDPTDRTWESDPGMADFNSFVDKYMPNTNRTSLMVGGYNVAQMLVEVLRRCGDDLTRENLMRQASHLQDLELPLSLPGIKINTSASNYHPITALQMMKFDGTRWTFVGEPIEGRVRN
jgi:branched-chain amino acid transport system substrate-binding protein